MQLWLIAEVVRGCDVGPKRCCSVVLACAELLESHVKSTPSSSLQGGAQPHSIKRLPRKIRQAIVPVITEPKAKIYSLSPSSTPHLRFSLLSARNSTGIVGLTARVNQIFIPSGI